jgi:hypothetical protein
MSDEEEPVRELRVGLGAKREYGDLIAAFGVFEDCCRALESVCFLSTP